MYSTFKEALADKKKKEVVIVNCTYWNTRCLGDSFKRHLTLEKLEEPESRSDSTVGNEVWDKTSNIGKQSF